MDGILAEESPRLNASTRATHETERKDERKCTWKSDCNVVTVYRAHIIPKVAFAHLSSQAYGDVEAMNTRDVCQERMENAPTESREEAHERGPRRSPGHPDDRAGPAKTATGARNSGRCEESAPVDAPVQVLHLSSSPKPTVLTVPRLLEHGPVPDS